MPLFALANTNISLAESSLDMLDSNLSLGILLALCLEKPVGITVASWLSVKIQLSSLPTPAR